MPLGINLRDRNVEVPLDDWGSDTQNRTHILMAILQANRIKTTDTPDEKITPFVVIEEPESFLHPSAQAAFGRMLRHLSDEFGASLLGVSGRTLQDWEQGRREPSGAAKTLIRVAELHPHVLRKIAA